MHCQIVLKYQLKTTYEIRHGSIAVNVEDEMKDKKSK